eukprot:7098970-Pyramimonas_sp.AAC.1
MTWMHALLGTRRSDVAEYNDTHLCNNMYWPKCEEIGFLDFVDLCFQPPVLLTCASEMSPATNLVATERADGHAKRTKCCANAHHT